MVTIRCQNGILGKKNGKCGRILGLLTDAQIDLLPLDPEGGPVFRCPQCPAEQRWVRISTNADKKLMYETIDPPENIPEEPEYADKIIYDQVG